MAKLIQASCSNCTYNSRFALGGGMRDHLTNCSAPAINAETREFEILNYFLEKDNPSYTFYDDDSLKRGTSGKTIRTSKIELTEDNNFCPKCEEFKLNFGVYGMAD